MGLLDIFRRKPAPAAIAKRRYAGANVGRLTSTAFGSSRRSADAELQPALSLLRDRSRDLARNNEYARAYFKRLRTNVVGKKGFNMQSRAYTARNDLDENANDQIEKAYAAWMRMGSPTVCGKYDGISLHKAILNAVAQDGDVFIVEHRGAKFKHSISFEILEADYLDENYNIKLNNGHEIRMGVEVDKYKKPVAYHFLQVHPGDERYSTITRSEKYKRVPADRVIHVYDPSTRVGLTRGEPWLSSVIGGLDQLGAYREAAIVNARVGASTMGFFTSPTGEGYGGDEKVDEVPMMDVEPGTFKQLPAGVNLEKFESSYPSNEFDPFSKSVLKGIASATGISYASLSGDLSEVSFSSVRQGALEERDYYSDVQSWLITYAIRPIFERWLGAAMEMGYITLPLRKYDEFAAAVEFRGRSWNWVDPQKEINAAVTGMKNGVMTLSDIASQYGKSVDELLKQIDRDRQLADKYGIKYALEPFGGNLEKVAPEIADE